MHVRAVTSGMLMAAVSSALLVGAWPGTGAADAPTSIADEGAPATSTSGAQIGGVAVCTDHDPRAWHPLVKRNGDGSIACTYGHEHKDNPHQLDGALGALPSYLGGEISYPWQTQNASTGALENDAKHRVYDWQVLDMPTCVAQGANGLSFQRMRAEYHADGSSGAATRFHSYWLQAQTCDPQNPSDRGTIAVGGHLDYGSLYLDPPGGPRVYVPLPGDKGAYSDDQRNHGSVERPRDDFTWYGSTRYPSLVAPSAPKVDVRVGLHKEDWGPIDPSNPSAVLFYGMPYNGSAQEPIHLLTLQLPNELDGLDGVNDGRVTYRGHTDRSGALVTCSTLGPDCVPLELQNVRVGVEYQFRADAFGDLWRDYDVTGPTGQSLIAYPN